MIEDPSDDAADEFESAVVHPDQGEAEDELPDQPRELPPPFFPPGTDRRQRRLAALRERSPGEGEAGFPEDAFIQPDDPIVRSRDEDDDEPRVTGMGGDEHRSSRPGRAGEGEGGGAEEGAPEDEGGLPGILRRLALEVREGDGELEDPAPDAPRAEVMLRGVISAYLASDEADEGA